MSPTIDVLNFWFVTKGYEGLIYSPTTSPYDQEAVFSWIVSIKKEAPFLTKEDPYLQTKQTMLFSH